MVMGWHVGDYFLLTMMIRCRRSAVGFEWGMGGAGRVSFRNIGGVNFAGHVVVFEGWLSGFQDPLGTVRFVGLVVVVVMWVEVGRVGVWAVVAWRLLVVEALGG